MREIDIIEFNAIDGSASSSSSAMDSSNVIKITTQAIMTGTSQGTVKIQASNDVASTIQANGGVPLNWTDLANSTVTLTSATSVILTPLDVCHGHLRLVYTPTAAGAQTVTTVADVSGSLNNTYFLLNDAGSVHKYYVWFNINSAGVDPLIAGRTAVPITGATNVSANTLATSLRSAIGALVSSTIFTTGGSNAVVSITNQSVGAFTPAVDGAVPTGFAFATTAGVGTLTATIKTIGD